MLLHFQVRFLLFRVCVMMTLTWLKYEFQLSVVSKRPTRRIILLEIAFCHLVIYAQHVIIY